MLATFNCSSCINSVFFKYIYKYFFIFQCYLSVSDVLNSFFSKSAPVLTNLNNLIV